LERRISAKKCSSTEEKIKRVNRSWKDDAIKVLLSNATQRAKRAGYEFSLKREDIIIPEKCPALGIELKREGRETWFSAPSIDRIDNTKGYTKENIVIVSRRANLLKKDATIEEMIKISEFYKKYL
jgi:predicted Zn-ribbon and HTH transcriptional regulator